MKPLEKQACNDEQEDRDEIADPKVQAWQSLREREAACRSHHAFTAR